MTRQEAAGALWNLSFDDRNREAIALAGGVEALVFFLSSTQFILHIQYFFLPICFSFFNRISQIQLYLLIETFFPSFSLTCLSVMMVLFAGLTLTSCRRVEFYVLASMPF